MAQDRATGPTDEEIPEPPQLRRLRRLVSALVAVMIGGILVVAATMVVRLATLSGEPAAPAPVDAGELALPADAEIVAVGRGPDDILMVTRDATGAETLRVFDARTGTQRTAVPIRRR